MKIAGALSFCAVRKRAGVINKKPGQLLQDLAGHVETQY